MPGSASITLGTNGINPDKKASLTERFGVEESGRYLQLRITNTTGRLTLRSTRVQAIVRDNTIATQTYQGG